MSSARSKLGHGLAKVLGIKVQEKEPLREELSRGESIFSIQNSEKFVEKQPTSIEWIVDMMPSQKVMTDYLVSLFPFVSWIGHYNWIWFIGDFVAGKSGSTAHRVE